MGLEQLAAVRARNRTLDLSLHHPKDILRSKPFGLDPPKAHKVPAAERMHFDRTQVLKRDGLRWRRSTAESRIDWIELLPLLIAGAHSQAQTESPKKGVVDFVAIADHCTSSVLDIGNHVGLWMGLENTRSGN